ncbi:regulator of sigma E protease [Paracoccus isoporae]|uniref:Zinc metalloprotease n=1 Tax=Paracoccus isoporae TaxID=591205 RepID=A0A1G7BHX6_9RHOB|nr:RIP metalloprotease RseP [Paracoccus isoporae]SDE26583.1 regulator of sigma E protease [Paracoccus isoporae]
MDIIAALGGSIWTIVTFLVALSVIVTVHEYGHYIVGRWSGIRAEVFSLGFGPRLLARRDRRGTLWQVAAIPLGGYVKFLGDANAASAGTGRRVDPALRRQTLEGAPLWARVATVSAGPVFNFILSALIFAVFMVVRGVPVDQPTVGQLSPTPPGVENALRPGDRILAIGDQPVQEWADLFAAAEALPPAQSYDWTVARDGAEIEVAGPNPLPTRIGGVAPRSAAAEAGLRAGDVILQVDGDAVTRFGELREKVEAAGGAPLDLQIWRAGETLDVTLTPKQQDIAAPDGGFEQRWLIGVTGDGYFAPATQPVGPLAALGHGIGQVWQIIATSLAGLWAMISGQIGSCNLGGAISIAESTGQAADAGAGNFIWWIAVLSVAIGFLNLLPIPVLDGGHLAFYAWEALTGRPPSERALRLLTSLGLALVLGLMFFGLSNDLRC